MEKMINLMELMEKLGNIRVILTLWGDKSTNMKVKLEVEFQGMSKMPINSNEIINNCWEKEHRIKGKLHFLVKNLRE